MYSDTDANIIEYEENFRWVICDNLIRSENEEIRQSLQQIPFYCL